MQDEYRIIPRTEGGLTLTLTEIQGSKEHRLATFNGMQSVPPFTANDELVLNQGTYRYVLKRWNIDEETGLVTEVEVLLNKIHRPAYELR